MRRVSAESAYKLWKAIHAEVDSNQEGTSLQSNELSIRQAGSQTFVNYLNNI